MYYKMSSDKEKIIKKIKHYMVDNDMNQQDFADRAGISRVWLNYILNGRKEANKKVLELIGESNDK